VRSFAEYARLFGGLDPQSEMSYAVHQFFVNGRSEAWIVRVAAAAIAQASADLPLPNGQAAVLKAAPFEAGNAWGAFIPPGGRDGIYALEAVELFNLLCLPGVHDPAILDEARLYCEKRRAFLLVDPPPGLTPDQVERDALRDLQVARCGRLLPLGERG